MIESLQLDILWSNDNGNSGTDTINYISIIPVKISE